MEINNPNSEFTNIHVPLLKVLGLGGGGCNAIERMMEFNLRGVDFIAANTDHQVLISNSAPQKIQLGARSTRGLGAGGDPQVGQVAAEESANEIADVLSGADMVFLTAGMGGGTGTGAIPVAAEIAREQGAAVIAVVTTPFSFEMGKRQKNATEGLATLRKHTHTLLTIPNDRLLYVAPRDLPMEVAFRLADDVLRQAVQGISEIIFEPGLINVDYAHIERMIRFGGGALLAIGQGYGNRKMHQAIEQALHHPLLEDINLDNAAGIIANITCGDDLSLYEIDDALRQLQEQTGSSTEIVLGVINNREMENRVQVILMVTGIGASTLEDAFRQVNQSSSKPETNQVPVSTQEPVHETSNKGTIYTGGSQPGQPRSKDQVSIDLPINEPPTERVSSSQNLEIPAFLRRRSRAVSSTN